MAPGPTGARLHLPDVDRGDPTRRDWDLRSHLEPCMRVLLPTARFPAQGCIAGPYRVAFVHVRLLQSSPLLYDLQIERRFRTMWQHEEWRSCCRVDLPSYDLHGSYRISTAVHVRIVHEETDVDPDMRTSSIRTAPRKSFTIPKGLDNSMLSTVISFSFSFSFPTTPHFQFTFPCSRNILGSTAA